MRLLSALLLLLAACPPAPQPFPDGYLFGASIAGFQVDMGCPTLPAEQCEDRRSDWYQFITSRAQVNASVAPFFTFDPPASGPGHWELYEQDFAAAKQDMGLNAMRLSIEWSRIFPTATDGLEGDALAAAASRPNVERYHQMFAALKARGLTPMVTLNHYTLPVWIHDGIACHQAPATCVNRGWLDKERMLREIARYAGFVAREFGGEVDLWATLNEPFAVVIPGYLQPGKDRVNPPAQSLRFEDARAVALAMIEAHARMYDAVKANDTKDADGRDGAASIGIVYPIAPALPKNPQSAVDRRGAENVFYLNNQLFLDGVLKGTVDANIDGRPDGPPRDDLKDRCDWLGVNYYTRATVTGTETASFPQFSLLSTFDPFALELWDDAPQGLIDALTWAKDRYGKPLYVTETGTDAAADPEKAASWLVRYLTATQRAQQQGVDVRGFFFWSLMDNYEWNHGMAMKFGLYAVANDAAKTRTPRSAVEAYGKITRARDVTPELRARYPIP
ncbi:MAG: glycoside hydrolase family 1 protein [Myxococcaceae bacterium]|nr:glycoside hydrolase family 1 protein [Myxococcaceae bacterium]